MRRVKASYLNDRGLKVELSHKKENRLKKANTAHITIVVRTGKLLASVNQSGYRKYEEDERKASKRKDRTEKKE